jgi:hypothetical protein
VDDQLVESFASERGFVDFFSPASPAAGANFSFTTGGLGADYVRLIAVVATLTTDANVANRLFALDYITGRSTTAVRNAATVLVTANTSATVYQWDTAHSVSEWNTGTPVYAPLLPMIFTTNWTIQLTVDNKQVGDTITAITFVLEKFYADS